jgi:hypothetical protein
MIIYPWRDSTREALHPAEKPDDHPNPIGRCETAIPTPTDIPTGYATRAVLSNDGWFKAWEVVIDNRGKKYWAQDGEKHSILDLGIEVPAGCLTSPPPSPFHLTHDGSAWIVDLPMVSEARRQERDVLLSASYSPTIEQLTRWIDEAEANPAALAHYKAQRSAWHVWADALCDLPNQSGFPWPDGDTPWPEQPPKPTRYTAP